MGSCKLAITSNWHKGYSCSETKKEKLEGIRLTAIRTSSLSAQQVSKFSVCHGHSGKFIVCKLMLLL